jgi:hypothetical protein
MPTTTEQREALRERALEVLVPSDLILSMRWLSRHISLGQRLIGDPRGNSKAMQQLVAEMVADDDGFAELSALIQDKLDRRAQQRKTPVEVSALFAARKEAAERRRKENQ